MRGNRLLCARKRGCRAAGTPPRTLACRTRAQRRSLDAQPYPLLTSVDRTRRCRLANASRQSSFRQRLSDQKQRCGQDPEFSPQSPARGHANWQSPAHVDHATSCTTVRTKCPKLKRPNPGAIYCTKAVPGSHLEADTERGRISQHWPRGLAGA